MTVAFLGLLVGTVAAAAPGATSLATSTYDTPSMGYDHSVPRVRADRRPIVRPGATLKPAAAPFENSVFVAPVGVAAKTGTDLVPYRAWPEGEGFLGGSKATVLKPGTLIDRYGSDGGRFVSPEGTPFGQRGLPSTRSGDSYSVFEVQKRTVVRGGTVAPWADSGGGGVQYKLPASVQDLLDAGYLSRVGQ